MKLIKDNLNLQKKNLVVVTNKCLNSSFFKNYLKSYLQFLEKYKDKYNVILFSTKEDENYHLRILDEFPIVDDIIIFNKQHKNYVEFYNESIPFEIDKIIYFAGCNSTALISENFKLKPHVQKIISDTENNVINETAFTFKSIRLEILVLLFLNKISKNKEVLHLLLDPDEIKLDSLDIKNKRFMFYKSKYYDTEKIGNYEYYLNNEKRGFGKSLDFVFGCSFKIKWRKKEEDNYIENLNKINLNKQLFFKGKNQDDFIEQTDYFDLLKQSKYTLIIPSNEVMSFSYLRFIEAIYFGCVPLILDTTHLFDCFNSQDNEVLRKYLTPLEKIEDKIKELNYEESIIELQDYFIKKEMYLLENEIN